MDDFGLSKLRLTVRFGCLHRIRIEPLWAEHRHGLATTSFFESNLSLGSENHRSSNYSTISAR